MKDQSFDHDQNIGRASFGLNPNKPLFPQLKLYGQLQFIHTVIHAGREEWVESHIQAILHVVALDIRQFKRLLLSIPFCWSGGKITMRLCTS
jgi:hypothetical protein